MEIFFPSSWLASFTNSFTGFEAIALGCLVFVAHQSGLGQGRGRLLRWMGAISLVLAYTLTDLGRASGQLWGPSWVSLSAAPSLDQVRIAHGSPPPVASAGHTLAQADTPSER
jgi:hypothetical protein